MKSEPITIGHRRSALVSSFATTGLVLLLSLGTSVLLARSLGPDGRGLLLALTFWPALLSSLSNLSLNEATAYHVAQRHASSGYTADLAGSALWLTVLGALVATVATVAALPFVVPAAYRNDLGIVTLYASAFVPLSALDLFFRAVVQGRGAIVSLNVMRVTQPLAYLAFIVLCAAVGRLDVTTVMAAVITALALSGMTGAALARVPVTAFQSKSFRPLLKSGWKFHRANVLLYGAAELDKMLVLLLMPIADVGFYAVAVAMSAIGTGVVAQSLGIMLVRDMAASEDVAWRRRVFVSSMRAAFAVLIGLNGIAAALAWWWVPLLFGGEFAAAIPATIILLAMGTFKGARHMADRSLRALHHTRTGMIGEVVAFASIAVLGAVGAATAGLEGLAVGLTVAQALALAVVLVLSKRHVGAVWRELWPLQRAAIADALDFYSTRRLSRTAS